MTKVHSLCLGLLLAWLCTTPFSTLFAAETTAIHHPKGQPTTSLTANQSPVVGTIPEEDGAMTTEASTFGQISEVSAPIGDLPEAADETSTPTFEVPEATAGTSLQKRRKKKKKERVKPELEPFGLVSFILGILSFILPQLTVPILAVTFGIIGLRLLRHRKKEKGARTFSKWGFILGLGAIAMFLVFRLPFLIRYWGYFGGPGWFFIF